MTRFRFAMRLFFVVSLVSSCVALAQDGGRPMIRRIGGAPPEDVTLTPMIGASHILDVEIGAKVSKRVADRGFIPVINNSVAVEGGVFIGNGNLVVEPILRWDFHVHPEWTVYPGLGAVLMFGDHHVGRGFSPVNGVGGAIWRPAGKSWSMRAEVDALLDSLRLGPVFYF